MLVVPPSLGVKTFAELIAMAKREPGKLNYGSTGAGSASHLAGELFAVHAGTDIVQAEDRIGLTALPAGIDHFLAATLHLGVGALYRIEVHGG